MTDNVVSLSGNPIDPPGMADQHIVDACENLLVMAIAGKLTGIVYAIRHEDGATSCANVGRLNMALVGELTWLAHKVADDIRRDD